MLLSGEHLFREGSVLGGRMLGLLCWTFLILELTGKKIKYRRVKCKVLVELLCGCINLKRKK